MIKVTIMNNVQKETVIVDEERTLRSVLEESGIDYAHGAMHLDGAPLAPGDMDRTFQDFGITETCFLTSVVKADNA